MATCARLRPTRRGRLSTSARPSRLLSRRPHRPRRPAWSCCSRSEPMTMESPTHAECQVNLRDIAFLAALDEAGAIKLLREQMGAAAIADDEMPKWCVEVDKFASRHGISLSRG